MTAEYRRGDRVTVRGADNGTVVGFYAGRYLMTFGRSATIHSVSPDDVLALVVDPDYAEQDTDGQLSLGVTGEQRAIPGLAKPREDGWTLQRRLDRVFDRAERRR